MRTKQLVWDIEGNDLLDGLENVWCLVSKDIETGSIQKFSDYDKSLPNMDYGVELVDSARHLVGHNLFGYDIPALYKMYGWKLDDETKVTDTWILSVLNRYKRTHAHGLKGWGEKLGSSKIEYDDWSHYNREMLRYCVQDVELNLKVYEQLCKEAKFLISRNPLYSKRIEVEMFVGRMNYLFNRDGWVYDRVLADESLKTINQKMRKIERFIEPQLGTKRVYKDKIPKEPKFTKKGWYAATTARLLSEFLGREVKPEDALADNPPIKAGETFQRYEDVPVTLGNPKDVKELLQTKFGWTPDEWNRTKNASGRWVNTTPILDGPALEEIGEVGKGVKEYAMLVHRRSSFEGFNKLADKRGDGRISGNMWTIGTPTFRVRHEGIVNLPGHEAPWGTEIRSLFKVEDDRQVVGADSAGNQLRGFCHVMGNDDYTQKIVYGPDAHQYNADLIGSTRQQAKVFIYRILFGSTAWGLAYAFGTSEEYAQELIDNFMKEVPEFEEVNARLLEEWNKNNGFIFGETGNLLFVDDPKNCLNSYLQDLEKATCAASMMWSWQKLREEGIDAYPLIFYHDEDAFAVKKEDVERAKPIIQAGFREGPKWFGVEIMDGGEAKSGDSYAAVH